MHWERKSLFENIDINIINNLNRSENDTIFDLLNSEKTKNLSVASFCEDHDYQYHYD
jgi:hypothetical protein